MPKYRFVPSPRSGAMESEDFETLTPLEVGESLVLPSGATARVREVTAEGFYTLGSSRILKLDVPEPTTPATAYPDGNPKSLQGAKKFSLRYLPLPAAVEVNRALEDGAKKYGAANWRKTGVAASVYVDAALRHLAQWYDGGQKDAADSGVHNLGHAMACLAILIDAESCDKLIDDRPEPCPDTDGVLLR